MLLRFIQKDMRKQFEARVTNEKMCFLGKVARVYENLCTFITSRLEYPASTILSQSEESMIEQDAFREILSALAALLGGPQVRFKDDGYAHLVYEKQLVFSFQFVRERKAMLAFVILGRVPEPVSRKVLAHALFANLFWQHTAGADLAYDSERQSLVLQQRIGLEGLSPALLKEKITAMGGVAEVWVDLLRRAARQESLPGDDTGEAAAPTIGLFPSDPRFLA